MRQQRFNGGSDPLINQISQPCNDYRLRCDAYLKRTSAAKIPKLRAATACYDPAKPAECASKPPRLSKPPKER
jgi:hypothetical protein